MQASDTLADLLDRLTKLHPKVIDMGLDRVEVLLKKLKNPHLSLPPVIHVAGTNGKGSTISTLHAILSAAGKTCHVMTSPHLVRFNERFVIGGSEIPDDDLVDLLNEVKHVNAGEPITFFEIITIVGLLAFARTQADFVLLETGMGGRLDATNIIPKPLLTMITMISFDHQNYLGNTLNAIATEKAGIMKSNVPCIIGKQTSQAISEKVLQVFEDHARHLHVPLLISGEHWFANQIHNQIQFRYQGQEHFFPRSSLIGAHQIDNAGNAIMAAKYIGGISDQAITQGLVSTQWPARLQKIGTQELYIDGGHNDSAGVVLAQQANLWHITDQKPLHLVLGMLSTKDPVRFIKPLAPYLASVTCVAIPDEPLSYSAQNIFDLIAPHLTCPIHQAHISKHILAPPQDQGRILVAGSLYLAGWILKNW